MPSSPMASTSRPFAARSTRSGTSGCRPPGTRWPTRRASSVSAKTSITGPEWADSKSGFRSRRDTGEGNSMKDTRRAFILAAGAATAALSLPRKVIADGTPRNGADDLALNDRTAKDLVALLQARKVSAVELVDRAVARIEAQDGKLNAVVVRDF